MAGISSLGIGSGLDIGTLVSDLVASERQPATERLDRQQAGYEAKLSALGRLKGALADFQASAQNLNSFYDFQARSATSANEGLFTAASLNTAVTGSYSVEVVRLAQAHKLGSAMLDADAALGGASGDSLGITVGAGTLTLDLAAGMTLGEIRDAINGAQANPGVVAAIVNGDNGQQGLVLTATQSGYENRVQLSYGGATVEAALGLATANEDAAGAPMTDLLDLDAEIVVDGYSATRATNSISDVMSGITLDLVGAEPGAKVALTVAADKAGASGAVSGLVESYNALAEVVNELGDYDPVNAEHGVLIGDATLRGVQGRLQRLFSTSVSGLSGSFSSLTGIGITTSANGALEVDSAKLERIVANEYDDLTSLFAGDDGIAARFDAVLSSYIGATGIIEARTEGLQSSLDGIAEQREALGRRLASVEKRYLAQFSAMDALVSQLTATSDFLTQQLDALPGFTRENK